ncbi:MAG: four helix bundle protein [Bacteroidetes bacterium]|nr:MAG: four helix bundle protein [Bacteroidota bacterium]
MATIVCLEELDIWILAREQAKKISDLISNNKFSNDIDLINQIRRSTGSVMDNISEGFERSGNKEFINFLLIAKGSNGEVRSQLYRAGDRNYISDNELKSLMTENKILSAKIASFIKYLQSSKRKGFHYN